MHCFKFEKEGGIGVEMKYTRESFKVEVEEKKKFI
jgi:hypothetical protein